MRNYLNLRFLESLDCFCYYTEIVLYESKFSLGFYGFYPSFHRAWVLLSLLFCVHCFWGAQFIGNWINFGALIFNRVLLPSPAKLAHCDWSQPQLTIQDPPRWQGDANCALNLEILLQRSRFRIFTIYRDFISNLFRFSFYCWGRRRFKAFALGLRAPE